MRMFSYLWIVMMVAAYFVWTLTMFLRKLSVSWHTWLNECLKPWICIHLVFAFFASLACFIKRGGL